MGEKPRDPGYIVRKAKVIDLPKDRPAAKPVENLPPARVVARVRPNPAGDPAGVYFSHLAEGSRATMQLALDEIADLLRPGARAHDFPWWTLRYGDTNDVRATLAERHAPATANLRLSALRGVLKAAWKLGTMSAEDYHRAVDLDVVKGSRVMAGREITLAELGILFAHCDDTPAGIRDAAILAVLFGSGIRRRELVKLDLAHYDGKSLRVIGKGNKERLLPLANHKKDGMWVSRRIEDWLSIRGRQAGPLFYPLQQHPKTPSELVIRRRMSSGAIYWLLTTRAEKAGLAHLTPHDFRRTHATVLLDAGSDLNAVKDLLGHANISTTSRYDRRGARAMRKALEGLPDPSVAPAKEPPQHFE